MPRVRMNGGVVGPPITANSTTASGMFSIVEAGLDKAAGNFPQWAGLADPYFNYNALLIHADGSNGALNNTFQDSSTNNYAVTRAGTAAQGSFSPYSQTGWSVYLPSGSYLINSGTNTGLQLGTGAFCIECWVNPDRVSGDQTIITLGSGGISFNLNGSGGIAINRALVAVDYTNIGNGNIKVGQWSHIAITRDGSSNMTVYINGVAASLASNSFNYTGGAMTLGIDANQSTTPLQGYISNLRVVKGSQVYTSAFTPSTTDLTAIANTKFLIAQSNRFVDNGGSNISLTRSGSPTIQPHSPFPPAISYGTSSVGGSSYFNGSTDYLTTNSAVGNLGTGDFTVETWVYLVSKPQSYPAVWSNYNSFTTGALSLFAGHASATATNFHVAHNGTFPAITSSSTIVYGTWTHLAVERYNGTLTLYVNGVSNGTYNSGTTNIATIGSNFYIGNTGDSPTTSYVNAHYSGFRVVKGSAVYKGAFTPPTSPVTAIANTQFLHNGTNAAIYDSTSKTNLNTGTTGGLSTTQAKFGASSMYFDGTSSSVIYTAPSTASAYPVSQPGYLGTGDFTIEGWFWVNAQGGYQVFATNRNTGGGAGTWWFGIFSGTLQPCFFDAATSVVNGAAITTQTWTHIAVCRSGTTLRLFVNGALNGSVPSATNSTNFNSSGLVSIGYSIVESNYGLTGYIDELRISKYARYTAAFTPATASFQNQ